MELFPDRLGQRARHVPVVKIQDIDGDKNAQRDSQPRFPHWGLMLPESKTRRGARKLPFAASIVFDPGFVTSWSPSHRGNSVYHDLLEPDTDIRFPKRRGDRS